MIDSGWAMAESRQTAGRGLDQIGYGLDTSANSSSPTCTATTTRRPSPCGRISGAPVALGEGEAASLAAIRDPERDPTGLRTRGCSWPVPPSWPTCGRPSFG